MGRMTAENRISLVRPIGPSFLLMFIGLYYMMDLMVNQEETTLERAYSPETSPQSSEGAEVVPPFPDRFGAVSPPSEISVSPPGIEPPPPPLPEEVLPVSFFGGILEKLKKVLPVFLALIVVVGLVLAGIRFFKGRQGVLPKKEVALTYWGLWEPASVMETIIADYQKEHPNIKINYSQESPQDYRERLQSAFARGEGPDIFRFHNTWAPMLKSELVPLSAEVIKEENYYPVVAKSLKRLDESFYGVPLMIDTLAFFVNDDIFRAAGKTPPATWEEFQKAALELTVRDELGRIQTAGAALGTAGNIDHWSDILGLMMLQNGVDMRKVDSTVGADGRNLGVDALTFYTLFSRVYKVWDETLPPSTLAFAGGKLAMYFGPSWRILNIKEANPDLNFRVLPVPQLPGANVTWASFWVEGVWEKSENKQEAINFLQYLSSREVLEKIYQAESQLRLFGELYPRMEMADLLSTNPLLAPFLAQAPDAQSWYLCSRTYDNGINDRTIKYFEDAVNSVNQGGSVQQALTTAAQGVTQLLSQYGVE